MSTTKRQNVRLARTWPWLCTIPLRRLLLRTRRSCCLLRPTRRPPVAARVLLAWVVGRKSSSPLYVVCPPTKERLWYGTCLYSATNMGSDLLRSVQLKRPNENRLLAARVPHPRVPRGVVPRVTRPEPHSAKHHILPHLIEKVPLRSVPR